jgi:hypothetical protein
MFHGTKLEDGSRDYGRALIDATVNGGFTFFSVLAAAGLVGDIRLMLLEAAIATGVTFFSSLILSLNISKPGTVAKAAVPIDS